MIEKNRIQIKEQAESTEITENRKTGFQRE